MDKEITDKLIELRKQYQVVNMRHSHLQQELGRAGKKKHLLMVDILKILKEAVDNE